MLALVLFFFAPRTDAYRIFGSDDVDKPFRPYERGFVGQVVDPNVPSQPIVNPGYEAHSMSTIDLPSDNRLRRCPGMVGPGVEDGKYYCTAKANGYCDRRSGKCFCSEGHAGSSCQACAQTHLLVGGRCLPKRICPNRCSNNGDCDYLTGQCRCNAFRKGDDCSLLSCEQYHPHCTHCNEDQCTACREGFEVAEDMEMGKQCISCASIDPRCIDCNITAGICTRCIDPLLLSTRRSGPGVDSPMPLPDDELRRNLSYSLPFGSQNPSYFDEAEVHFVVDPELSPLNASTVACHQGLNQDASLSCHPTPTSHVVCGNHGSIYFASPYYEVSEDEGFVRIALLRSGGGIGTVSVSYHIQHLSTDDSDITPTAFYATNQTVEFGQGQIQQSFLVTVNNDRILEEEECFSVSLSVHAGPAELGNQKRATVCIIDDDSHRTCSLESEMLPTGVGAESKTLTTVAGESLAFTIQAKSCAGEPQQLGSDHFYVVATRQHSPEQARGYATITDFADGTYEAEIDLLVAGKYQLDVYQLIPGGLFAQYFNDALLDYNSLEKSKVDPVLNHTWGVGRVTSSSTDFVSVRWTGVLRSAHSEIFTFSFQVDDHVRFWIDSVLLIDAWDDSATESDAGPLSGDYIMTKGKAHEIIIEYRDLAGDATVKFFWSSASTPFDVVPSSALFYMEPIKGNTLPLIVRSARTSALRSTASGPGLSSGVAGHDHSFVVVPRDEFGNLRSDDPDDMLTGRDGFIGMAMLVDNQGGGVGSEQVPIEFVYDRHDHTYVGNFVPTISGVWQVNITLSSESLLGSTGSGLGSDHIVGSPFMVQTSPGVTFAQESYAHGIGLQHGIAGVTSTFVIEARDVHRNVCESDGSDDWDVVLRDEDAEYEIGSVEHEGDGRYQATVVPKIAGTSYLSITLNGVHLKGSPFEMIVAHGDLDGGASDVRLVS